MRWRGNDSFFPADGAFHVVALPVATGYFHGYSRWGVRRFYGLGGVATNSNGRPHMKCIRNGPRGQQDFIAPEYSLRIAVDEGRCPGQNVLVKNSPEMLYHSSKKLNGEKIP
jgi:hypothetical protein